MLEVLPSTIKHEQETTGLQITKEELKQLLGAERMIVSVENLEESTKYFWN